MLNVWKLLKGVHLRLTKLGLGLGLVGLLGLGLGLVGVANFSGLGLVLL